MPQPQGQSYYQQQFQQPNQQFQQQQQYQQEQYQEQYDQQEYDDYEEEQNFTNTQSKPLVLRQGSHVQFTSKNPNPGAPKSPEASHLGEEKHAMIRPTVCQFPKDVPDPNAKLVEGSHLGEEAHRPIFRQGGVSQFPKEYKAPWDYKGYHPVNEVVQETMPLAEVEHPDHLLPSQARSQQTYITHPMQKIRYRSPHADDAIPRGQNIPEWPPRSGVQDLPRVGFNSDQIHPAGSRSFVWPPPKSNETENRNPNGDLPAPGSGPAANAWNPQTNGQTFASYRAANVQRKQPVWPPPERNLIKNQPEFNESSGSRKNLEFNEYMQHRAGTHIPRTYHTPPNTQYYEVQYELVE
ncbi:uncharacterized protein LOC141852788 [Brevipalpus obovatus]|uniref:uncharacterized protein LOC141852788 n=1 Tax=Brevipalpus obovatus TaxID=246614 RepID=UPI003D9DC27A